MKLSEKLWGVAQYLLAMELTYEYNVVTAAAAVVEHAESTTPRPWPPPAGVTRCLGWDKDNERWRVCIHEYGGWVFEDGFGPVRHWCPVWQPMPPEPEVGP